MRRTLVLVFLGCCSLPAAQSISPQVKEFVKIDAPLVVLTHVRVIDGTGAAAREDQTVVLSKGKIESVSDALAANAPKEAQVLDRAWWACTTTWSIPWATASSAKWDSASPASILREA